MVNLSLLLLHSLVIIAFALAALRIGKEALVVWVVFQSIIANLLVIKQMEILGLNVTCSDVYVIGSILGLNLIQEYYSKELARKTTWICFFFMVFFALAAQIHLLYIPSAFDSSQSAYHTILGYSPRLLMASLTSYLIVQQVDIRVFSRLKTRLSSSPLIIRNFVSIGISQALDTVLFSILGLYGIVDSILEIMLFSYLVKLVVFAILAPLSLFAHKVVNYDRI